MGSKFFQHSANVQNQASNVHPTQGMNMMARSIGQPAYTARSAASNANKDLGMLKGLDKAGLSPVKNSAATNAPGPKKV